MFSVPSSLFLPYAAQAGSRCRTTLSPLTSGPPKHHHYPRESSSLLGPGEMVPFLALQGWPVRVWSVQQGGGGRSVAQTAPRAADIWGHVRTHCSPESSTEGNVSGP